MFTKHGLCSVNSRRKAKTELKYKHSTPLYTRMRSDKLKIKSTKENE